MPSCGLNPPLLPNYPTAANLATEPGDPAQGACARRRAIHVQRVAALCDRLAVA